ncbi:MAG TPA: single-stranded DNA-binding protein [Chloroflexota bacterium]|jgi:single-strand DNA-binding protein|nr:single-stranded DNA-binding protein [Chloroflexota bacterium]
MARSLNKCMIIGNLGRDPEMRYTPQGTAVTSFSVAVSRSFNSRDGEQQEETDWFRVTAWDKLAEICNQYLTKGQRVYVEGRVSMRMWDGNDGQKHGSLELRATDMMMLSAKGEAVAAGVESPRDEAFSGGDLEPDDIPF